jgi:hypothetical protein
MVTIAAAECPYAPIGFRFATTKAAKMVMNVPDDGPRDVTMSLCVSERLSRAIRARAGRTGQSRSEILNDLIDRDRAAELIEDEAAMQLASRTETPFGLPARVGNG